MQLIRLLLVEDIPIEVHAFDIDLRSLPAVKESRIKVETHLVDCEEDFHRLLEERKPEEFDGIVMDVILPWTRPDRIAFVEDQRQKFGLTVDLKDFDAGIRCCHVLREKGWSTPVLLCSHYSERDIGKELAHLPASVVFSEKARLRVNLERFLERIALSAQDSAAGARII